MTLQMQWPFQEVRCHRLRVTPPALALMMILNLRLGQWLPNPRMKAAWQRPTYWQICKDLHRPAEERAFCFLSDGGHRENPGLAPLLRRRCKLIIVSDAGYDPDHTFADFLKVCRTARSRYGTQLFDLVSKRSISLTDLQLKLDNLQDASRNARYRLGVTQKYFLAVGIRYHRPCTVVNDKGDSWSSNTRAAITEMLDSFRHEDKAHNPGRKSSSSKR